MESARWKRSGDATDTLPRFSTNEHNSSSLNSRDSNSPLTVCRGTAATAVSLPSLCASPPPTLSFLSHDSAATHLRDVVVEESQRQRDDAHLGQAHVGAERRLHGRGA